MIDPASSGIEVGKEAEKQKEKLAWYFNAWAIAILILCIGPLGLIPLWFRPATKPYIKVLVSVVVFILTYYSIAMTADVFKKLMDYYKELGELLK